MRFILILLLLTACHHDYKYRIDPDLAHYVEQFYTEAINQGIIIQRENLIVEFGTPTHNASGVGIKKRNGQLIVRIDYAKWYSNWNPDTVDLVRQYLMFHELGHTLLHREHNDLYSIMNPKGFLSDYCNDKTIRETLLKELF